MGKKRSAGNGGRKPKVESVLFNGAGVPAGTLVLNRPNTAVIEGKRFRRDADGNYSIPSLQSDLLDIRLLTPPAIALSKRLLVVTFVPRLKTGATVADEIFVVVRVTNPNGKVSRAFTTSVIVDNPGAFSLRNSASDNGDGDNDDDTSSSDDEGDTSAAAAPTVVTAAAAGGATGQLSSLATAFIGNKKNSIVVLADDLSWVTKDKVQISSNGSAWTIFRAIPFAGGTAALIVAKPPSMGTSRRAAASDESGVLEVARETSADLDIVITEPSQPAKKVTVYLPDPLVVFVADPDSSTITTPAVV